MRYHVALFVIAAILSAREAPAQERLGPRRWLPLSTEGKSRIYLDTTTVVRWTADSTYTAWFRVEYEAALSLTDGGHFSLWVARLSISCTRRQFRQEAGHYYDRLGQEVAAQGPDHPLDWQDPAPETAVETLVTRACDVLRPSGVRSPDRNFTPSIR